jgi:hypothetical protein
MLETLLEGVRSACAAFPDKRRGDVAYGMADIGLSAFSLFFMQSESFLAHQRALGEGRQMSNCHSLFGMTAVPTDKHIRSMLDPVRASHLQPAFDQALGVLLSIGTPSRPPIGVQTGFFRVCGAGGWIAERWKATWMGHLWRFDTPLCFVVFCR